MRALAALALALLLVAAAPAGLSPRRYEVPGQKALRLDMPGDWREEIKRPRPSLPPTIRITTDSRDLKVMLTPMGPARGRKPLGHAELKALTEDGGRRLLPTAVETELELRRLKGRGISGWYYSLEDRAPKPGEYAYMTQGNAKVGTLLLAFTVLSHDREGADHAAAMRMIRSARQ